MDISWISSQAKEIHQFFVSIFYSLAILLLVIGVLIDYFKMPVGGMPAFQQLVGRALVAAILLTAYPQILHAHQPDAAAVPGIQIARQCGDERAQMQGAGG